MELFIYCRHPFVKTADGKNNKHVRHEPAGTATLGKLNIDTSR